MKLLLDENLPPQMAASLQQLFPGTVHLRDVDLKGCPDGEIWDYAREHDFVILTKDSDFQERSVILGHPPKVVWLRIGNCNLRLMLEGVVQHATEIQKMEHDDASLLEVRYFGTE